MIRWRCPGPSRVRFAGLWRPLTAPRESRSIRRVGHPAGTAEAIATRPNANTPKNAAEGAKERPPCCISPPSRSGLAGESGGPCVEYVRLLDRPQSSRDHGGLGETRGPLSPRLGGGSCGRYRRFRLFPLAYSRGVLCVVAVRTIADSLSACKKAERSHIGTLCPLRRHRRRVREYPGDLAKALREVSARAQARECSGLVVRDGLESQRGRDLDPESRLTNWKSPNCAF